MSTEVDWEEIRKEFEYVESDSFAVIRNGNTLQWLPAFLNAATGKPFIKENGKWVSVDDVRGFERFEKIKVPTKTLYDPLAQRVYEIPKYV